LVKYLQFFGHGFPENLADCGQGLEARCSDLGKLERRNVFAQLFEVDKF
jgi:hypothetical protein